MPRFFASQNLRSSMRAHCQPACPPRAARKVRVQSLWVKKIGAPTATSVFRHSALASLVFSITPSTDRKPAWGPFFPSR
jgi:hypothetical protein